MKICNCKPGFTGRQCEESTLTPCSPDPCSPNGYCNSNTDSPGYFCRCKPGFTGPNCQENINDCLNATCHNGGSCIDGINSYQCDCIWPYIGRYCQTRMKCTSDSICKNNGVCYEDVNSGPKCFCEPGYDGVDCSIKIDKCKLVPCQNEGKCIRHNADYKCECKIGFMGKNCQLKDVCYHKMPCKNNSTCISVTYGDLDQIDLNQSHKYYCQCKPGFTGPDCSIRIFEQTTTSTTTTTTTTSSTTTTTLSTPNEKINGSFVLVVNINPNEFHKRQSEIIGEFEKKFGILMSIRKEPQSQNEMVYPFHSNNSNSNSIWTKVYFVFISACIQNDFLSISSNETRPLCLQNNVNNLNDVNEVLNEIKKSSNLFPKYVSNVSYEAYTDSSKRNEFDESRRNSQNSGVTNTMLIFSIAVLFAISLALIVVIMQNTKKIKAPIWFPPLNDLANTNEKSNTYNGIIEMQGCNQIKSSHSMYKPKTFDHSPPSSENDYGDLDTAKPVKMRKLEIPIYSAVNHNSSTSSAGSTRTTNTTVPSPEFYPSPPESIPDSLLNPVNYKGGSYGMTPLMLFVMGRSKYTKYSSQQESSSILDIIDTFVHNGADLNSQNNDGETALHLAARCGLYEVCERLIKNNAELNVFDNYGRNVLHTAVCSNEYNIVKLILDHCSSILCANNSNMLTNQTNLILDEKYDLIDSKTNDEMGDTPLIISARLNLNNILQLLVDYNATVNATDNEGRSALHWCSKVNNANGAMILLKSGANVNMQDNDERTPLSSALTELCTLEVADLLIKFDAFVSSEDEIKYTKMKSIIQNLNGGVPLISQNQVVNLKPIKNELLLTVNKEQKNQTKSTGTKRKLSDTLASGSSTTMSENKMNSLKPSKKITKTQPKTPSPPPIHTQPSISSISNQNYTSLVSNQYNTNGFSSNFNQKHYPTQSYYYDSNNHQISNSYEYNYLQPTTNQQQQQYNQIYSAYSYYTSTNSNVVQENTNTNTAQSAGANGTPVGGNVNFAYLSDYNTTNQSQQQQLTNATSNSYYSPTYAAYF